MCRGVLWSAIGELVKGEDEKIHLSKKLRDAVCINDRLMKTNPYRVGLILHEDYGNSLEKLLARMPLCVVDTPSNREALHCLNGVIFLRKDFRISEHDVSL